jgi:hypothetical protein
LLILACLGTLAAANAGRLDEDGTGAVWVAPELLAVLETSPLAGCMHDLYVEPTQMPSEGRVAFEWHPETGELSFADPAAPALTHPAASSPFRRPEPQPLAIQSCESR